MAEHHRRPDPERCSASGRPGCRSSAGRPIKLLRTGRIWSKLEVRRYGSLADPDATVPAVAVSPPSREAIRTLHAHIEAARVRGSEPTAAFAPSGPTGSREFLAERLALFGRVACLASSGFLIMRLAITASLEGERVRKLPGRPPRGDGDPLPRLDPGRQPGVLRPRAASPGTPWGRSRPRSHTR